MFRIDYNIKRMQQGNSRKPSFVGKSLLMGLTLAIYLTSSTYAADLESRKENILKKLEENNKKIELFKNNLHSHQVIIKAKELIDLGDRSIKLQSKIEDIDEKINCGEYSNKNYCFFNEDKKEIVVGPTLEAVKSQFNIARENLEAYFKNRQGVNNEVIIELDKLLGTLKTKEAKKYLLSLKTIIAKNEKRILNENIRISSILDTPLKEKEYDIGESTSKQSIKNHNKRKIKFTKKDLNDKIYECQSVLHQDDKFSLVGPLIYSIKASTLPTDFLSENFLQDLNKVLTLYTQIFKNELIYFYNDVDRNKINMCISGFFLSIHEKAQDLNIQVGDRKQMTMASMHFANKYLNSDHIKQKYLDEDSSLDFNRLYNIIEPFEGKYVTWHLNRGFNFYNTILFVTPGINEIALNFYKFSHDILAAFEFQALNRMIFKLKNSGLFQNPIVMSSESIWVYKKEPYVVRIKTDGDFQYSIGLVENSYIDESFFYKNTKPYSRNAYNMDYWDTYDLYGDHYKLTKYTHNSKIFPSICDEENEILKYSSLGCYGTFIPANWLWENKRNQNPKLKLVSEWEEKTGKFTKDTLMKKAHLTYPNK